MFRAVMLSLISSAPLLMAAPQPQPFRHPLVFEPNRGQAPAQVKWLARGPGYQLFLTEEGLTMMIREGTAPPALKDGVPNPARSPNLNPALKKRSYSAVQMKLTGSRPWKSMTGLQPTGGISNYLYGKSGESSHTGIPHYARLKIGGVYEGVDLVFYSNGGDLEYDFVVAPGADPKQIRLAFEGQDRMRVDAESGDLVLMTAGGSELRQIRPNMYQQVGNRRVEVAGAYELLDGKRARFTLAAYDPHYPLVIDPMVSFTRFLGGSKDDIANGVAVDAEGNSYVTGDTASSSDFPELNAVHHWDDGCPSTSWFPPYGFCSPGLDAFVAKLSPSGDILFATYLGGGHGRGVAVDSDGVYVTGDTYSDNFLDKGADGSTSVRLGGDDLFVTKLSLNGITVIYSRILSGTGDDSGHAIAVDSQHAVWVTGNTTSRAIPVGVPFNNYYAGVNGPSDLLYAKYDSTGKWLFSGFVGGSGSENGAGVAIDPDDNPWFTGQTCSADFPATPGYSYLRGSCGVVVLRMMNQTQIGTVQSAMVFGGGDDDAATAIVVDANREAYVTGYTRSSIFPVTGAAYQTVPSSAGPQAFVTKLDGLHWINSTFLGGDGDTYGRSIALSGGRVYVSGETTSSNFPGTAPLTPNPTAGFVSRLSADLHTLAYTRLLGAAVNGIAVPPPALFDQAPAVYAAGWRYTGPSQDAFVVKLDDDLPTTTTVTSSANPSVSKLAVTFEAMVSSNGGMPIGRVAFFYDETHLLGYAPLSTGTGRLSTSILPLGLHSIQAQYEGDGKFGASASAALSQTVVQHATSLTLQSSANPSSSNQPVTFTARIVTNSGNASGTVTLFRKNGPHSGPSIVGSGTLSNNAATITIPSLFVGDNIITAVFAGSTDYAPSQSASITQTVKPAATSTKLTSSLNPAKAGQSVKFTANVAAAFGGTPSGTITFKKGASTLGTAALSGGTATFSTSSLATGQRSISAIYAGDSNDAPSSKTMTVQVK